MTQEVQVTLTLEVDLTLGKVEVQDVLERAIAKVSNLELIKIDSIKEEAEIYENE